MSLRLNLKLETKKLTEVSFAQAYLLSSLAYFLGMFPWLLKDKVSALSITTSYLDESQARRVESRLNLGIKVGFWVFNLLCSFVWPFDALLRFVRLMREP